MATLLPLVLVCGGCKPDKNKAAAKPDAGAAASKVRATKPKPKVGADGVPAFMDNAPTLPAAKTPDLPLAKRFKLPAGLEVRYIEKRDLPLVRFGLLIKRGTASAAPGVAYVTAKMLAEGAGKRGALDLSAALQQIGAELSISIGLDFIEIDLEVLKRHVDAGLSLLSDIVQRPRFEPTELRRLAQRLAARAQSRRARATAVAPLVFHKVLFGEDPYGIPRLPTPAVIRSVKRAAVVAFHRDAFTPDSAVLAVAGDIDRAGLVTALGTHFGSWKAQGSKKQGAAAAKPPADDKREDKRSKKGKAAQAKAPRLVFVDKPGAPQSVLRIGMRCPGRRSVKLAPLRALFKVLGGSFTSRLNQSLRETHGYTYGASASASLYRRAGLVAVRTSVKTSVTEPAIVEIMKQLEAIRDAPVTPAEANKARRQLIDAMPARLESVSGLVDAQTTLALYDLPLDADRRLATEYAAVSAADMQAVARARLRLGQLTIVVVGDTSTFAKKLEKRYGPATYLGPDGEALPRPKAKPAGKAKGKR
ncbi:MAG: insulinase family protein [Myxococcales bacterium]|nr:insulinase family protein [Myxococcales bacterium]